MRLFFILSYAFLLSISQAQVPLQSASPEELIEKLNPTTPSNSVPFRTRGFRNLTPEVKASTNASTHKSTNSADKPMASNDKLTAPTERPSVELVIQFEFNSSTVLSSSKPLLDNLAKAVNSDQLRSFSFMIEGHTDAVGTPAYNLKLSDQRAVSVMRYLMTKGVSKDRLNAAGKGSTELLLPDKPDAAENRRVKIILNS